MAVQFSLSHLHQRTNEKGEREPANNAGSPSAAAPARFLNLETHAPSTYYLSFFCFPDVKERSSEEKRRQDDERLVQTADPNRV